MKQQRKDELMHSFPCVPQSIMDQMKGRLAANFAVFLTDGNELFVRCYHRYSDGKLFERQRYVFANDGSVRWGKDDYSPWAVRKEFREPVFCQSCYGYSFDNSYRILNKDAIRQSCMKYCCYDLYKGDLLIEYLHLYCRHPNLEYIMKSGYSALIGEHYTGFWGGIQHITADRHINWKSNNLLKMLGLSRTEFKGLEGREELYSQYVTWREHYPKCRMDDLLLIADVFGYEYGTAESFIRLTGLKPQRIARYLKEQNAVPHDYHDYLRQCTTLKYDLHDTAISMPHNFSAMHTRLSEIIKYNETKEARKMFSLHTEYRKQLEFEYGNLFIRQPKSMKEIVSEGKNLHHCVGGYAERHARMKLHIMFIRKEDKPSVPFYTVEVDLFGKIVQVRGLKNAPMTEEVKAFIEEYEKYLAETLGKQKVRKTA